MEIKQIAVQCPCCSTQLTVDVLTQTVLRALSPEEHAEDDPAKRGKARWDKAQGRVDERPGKAKDKLESALSKEKDKESHLDDLFDQASAKVKRREEEREEFDS